MYKPFDWSLLLNLSIIDAGVKGFQILHFNSQNKESSEETSAFIKSHLSEAEPVKSDADVLRKACEHITIPGYYLEMGVCSGRTINFIAALNPHKKIHGFDSFQGLPEDWIRPDMTLPKDIFAFRSPRMLPPVLSNVVLYPGWFSNSLPDFKKNLLKETPIAFLHIDCDLYRSTKEIFELLGHNIASGTIIVFDEFYNYPGFEHHEFKAFTEFLQTHNLDAKFLYYNIFHEQVAVQIILK